MVPTFIMMPDLENHRNMRNTKKPISQEQNRTVNEIKKSELASQMTNFENLSFCSRGNHRLKNDFFFFNHLRLKGLF